MRRRGSRGFTLIEVLLSATILATLSMLAARSIQQAVRAKTKLQGQIDEVSKMRDALRLIERDINLAFHYRDVQKELDEMVRKLNRPKPKEGMTPEQAQQLQMQADQQEQQAQEGREAPRHELQTHFQGSENAVNFVTMNNARMVRNTRQADFIEIGYALRDCQSVDGKRSSKCLWRRSSPSVDDDVSKGGDEVVLLEEISEFSLQYIGKGKQDWVKDWKTDRGGDATTRGKFPQAVQISLTVERGEGEKKKKFSMQIVASIHFPNNKEDDRAGTSTTGSSGSPGDLGITQ